MTEANFRVWLLENGTKRIVLVSAPSREDAIEKASEQYPDGRVVHAAPYPAEGEAA